jgi:hypothetical protein
VTTAGAGATSIVLSHALNPSTAAMVPINNEYFMMFAPT